MYHWVCSCRGEGVLSRGGVISSVLCSILPNAFPTKTEGETPCFSSNNIWNCLNFNKFVTQDVNEFLKLTNTETTGSPGFPSFVLGTRVCSSSQRCSYLTSCRTVFKLEEYIFILWSSRTFYIPTLIRDIDPFTPTTRHAMLLITTDMFQW